MSYLHKPSVLAAALSEKLDGDEFRELYNAIRRQVYGIPRAIDLRDLLHCLAELNELPDPSTEERSWTDDRTEKA